MIEKPENRNQDEPGKTPFTDAEKQSAISSLKDEIRNEVFGWLKRWRLFIIGGLSACSIIGFIGICYQIYVRVRHESAAFITTSITEKFAEQNIKDTLQSVASHEAQTIIQNEVQPEAVKVKKQITTFENYLNQMELQFNNEYKSLADQVSTLKKRNELMQLTDNAINNGSRGYYEELWRTANDMTQPEEIRAAAKSEWLQVKRFYIGLTRVKGKNLSRWQPDGTKVDVKNEDVSTQELIQALFANKEWTVRVLAASMLKDRKEKGVPEALLQAAHNDQNLDVVKESIDSFQSVTGYKSVDVFGAEVAEVWWQANKVGIEAQLKEQSQKTINQ